MADNTAVTALKLQIAKNAGEIEPWNRIENHSGALGTAGWTGYGPNQGPPYGIFPGENGGRVSVVPTGLSYASGGTGFQYLATAWIPALAGKYAVAGINLLTVTGYIDLSLQACDVAGNYVVWSGTTTSFTNAAGVKRTGVFKIPAGARYIRLHISFAANAAGTTPPAPNVKFTWKEGILATSVYESLLPGLAFNSETTWVDVLGSTHEIAVSRSELDVSTLTATILDATLDPSITDLLHPGARARLTATTAGVDEPIFTGRTVDADVTYERSPLDTPTNVYTQLVRNPNPTANLDYWGLNNATNYAFTATADGARIVTTGLAVNANDAFRVFTKLPVVPGRTYGSVQLQARRNSGPQRLTFAVRAFDANDNDLGAPAGSSFIFLGSAANTNWVTHYLSIGTLPANAAYVNLWFGHQGQSDAPNFDYHLRQVYLTEGHAYTLPADPKATRITLTAHDDLAQLAAVQESRGVGTIAGLADLLEGFDRSVPYVINGSADQIKPPAVVATNDNASLLDQIVIARDTGQGYAHLSRQGVLVINGPTYVPTDVKAELDEAVYGNADVRFSIDDLINSVRVRWMRAVGGETVETLYGPYQDAASVAKWGLREIELTWQGSSENPATIQAAAEAILTANAAPVRRVNSVTLPIRSSADLPLALLDLMDLVQVDHARTDLDAVVRVRAIQHRITASNNGSRWTVELGFAGDGSAARAIPVTPANAAKASGWNTLALAANFGAYDAAGTGYAQPQYKVAGGRCYLRGLVRTTAARAAGTITLTGTALPAEARPVESEIFTAIVSGTITTGAASAGTAHTHPISVQLAVRLGVSSDGVITFQLTSMAMAVNGFVSLSGISWDLD